MGDKLSHKLIDLGFFSALGTSEHPRMTSEEIHVRRGKPNTYDFNNGVTVVYDEHGCPWIICNGYNKVVAQGLRDAVREHELERGAYVPHSNDGGHFVHDVLPKFGYF